MVLGELRIWETSQSLGVLTYKLVKAVRSRQPGKSFMGVPNMLFDSSSKTSYPAFADLSVPAWPASLQLPEQSQAELSGYKSHFRGSKQIAGASVS